ncbi:hypothetical protein K503DRAFT_801523 [Rhizopogon vinicolor AM-OR11-026]|uniref:Uncharacterized protein n=1 Tax=Rhizopogon vinicolor AM-OR11-026 TaxID=1314800 RepID=A0A1B7MWU0_9AGAM|nr:hypothetical protein K503DRAFT_801523 [Rhizopogon vinicolor AM-OR11-026]
MEISPATLVLPEYSPNLMPFHISHSGPAPISAYFRVKPSPSSSAHLSFTQNASNEINLTTDDSQNTLIAEESQCSLATFAESQSASLEEDSQATAATMGAIEAGAESGTRASPSSEVTGASPVMPMEASSLRNNNFVAAFRGRQVHGRTVDLPHGYGGIVLNAPLGDAKSQTGDTGAVEKMTQTRGKGRTTRQSNRRMGADEDDTMDSGQGVVPDDASHTKIQRLTPISRFSSLTVWSPDIPVDEGKDEYIRSLIEWTKLAAEIHTLEA